jgi:hypothetical protein
MRPLHTATALAFAIGLSLIPMAATVAAPGPAAAKAAPNDTVEPAALQALMRMSDYLGTLSTFEIKSDTTLDIVTKNGQRLQLGGVAQYKVRRPNGFQIDVVSDFRSRRFYFDGKQFTVFAPKLGYYATAEAPPTIRETLDVIYNKYGIALPLEDLFRWSDPDSPRAQKLTSGFLVGPAIVGGVTTDHYAFREGDHDWEIWIQQGEQPIPRKLAIVDRSDPARPAYVARLSWNVRPARAICPSPKYNPRRYT